MSIESLPNELLAPILNHRDIPLQERIQLRAVSSRWLTVIEEGLTKETALVLRGKYLFCKIPNEPDDLMVSDPKFFNADLSQLLGRLFPSITQLTVSFCSNYRELPGLLSKFSTTLKSFTLAGRYTYKNIFDVDYKNLPVNSKRIGEAINTLTSLTCLKLVVSRLGVYLPSYLKPTLARLERFALHDDAYTVKEWSLAGIIFSSLNDRCTSLSMDSDAFDWISTKVDANLTELALTRASGVVMTKIGSKFHLLNSLSVRFNYSTTIIYLKAQMLRALSSLNQLTKLQLDDMIESLERPSKNEQSLSSVKELHLKNLFICDDNFNGLNFCKTIAAWFPKLEQLAIQCEPCFTGVIEQNLNQFPNLINANIEPKPYYFK